MEGQVALLKMKDKETWDRLIGYQVRKDLLKELSEKYGYTFKVMTQGAKEVRVSTGFSSWIITMKSGKAEKLLHHDNAASNDSQGPVLKEGLRYHEHTGFNMGSADINVFLEYIRDHELSQFSAPESGSKGGGGDV